MDLLKQEKGSITLFVLISMIFFLMFLAGMYMLSATAEKGVIEEQARIKEIYEQGVNNIDEVYATLENDSRKYLRDVAKPGDYIQYILKEKTFKITPEQTGQDNEQEFNTSDYKGLWQVLYNDNEHGLQIISETSVATLTLGCNTTNNETAKEKVRIAYNNIVNTLNDFCKNYINTVYTKDLYSARCVGSNPIVLDDKTSNDETEKFKWNNVDSGFKVKDDNYLIDYNAMKEAKSRNENGIVQENCWLASRHVYSNDDGANFNVRFVIEENNHYGRSICAISPSGYLVTSSHSKGVRPVITLKTNIQTDSGYGSKDSPFNLIEQ